MLNLLSCHHDYQTISFWIQRWPVSNKSSFWTDPIQKQRLSITGTPKPIVHPVRQHVWPQEQRCSIIGEVRIGAICPGNMSVLRKVLNARHGWIWWEFGINPGVKGFLIVLQKIRKIYITKKIISIQVCGYFSWSSLASFSERYTSKVFLVWVKVSSLSDGKKVKHDFKKCWETLEFFDGLMLKSYTHWSKSRMWGSSIASGGRFPRLLLPPLAFLAFAGAAPPPEALFPITLPKVPTQVVDTVWFLHPNCDTIGFRNFMMIFVNHGFFTNLVLRPTTHFVTNHDPILHKTLG